MNPVRVGIVGCGAIAPAYLRHLTTVFSPVVRVVACADLVPEAAAKRAAEFGVSRACSAAELLADPEIELVVNLTPAPAHHATSLEILRAGKHLFTEKPLALTREQGREILTEAAARALRVAGAADTFLGAGLQRCRQLIDAGRIGTPVGATALVTIGAFDSPLYHQVFRGALLDLGPYYLGALVALLGSVSRVAAAGPVRWTEKIAGAKAPNPGQPFTVDFPTTVAASLEFAAGGVCSLLATCDAHNYFPRVEIVGTEGCLVLNDANHYGGQPILRTRQGEEVFSDNPGFAEKGRGLGVAEMAVAIRQGRAPAAHGDYLYHILDIMLAAHDAAAAGRQVAVASTIDRPAVFDVTAMLAGGERRAESVEQRA